MIFPGSIEMKGVNQRTLQIAVRKDGDFCHMLCGRHT